MRLADRVIVVTGSTGIAASTAATCAANGASVFVVAIDPATTQDLVESIVSSGATAEAAEPTDLTDEKATEAAFARCLSRFGKIDGLVAVAGGSGRRFGDGPLHDVPLAGWEATFRVNGHPTFLAAREAVRVMRTQEPGTSGTRGSVVLVSSVLATHPSPALFSTHAYAAVKGAQISLGRAMAATYAPDLIRINVICPGLVDTPMAARAAADPASVRFAGAKQPLAAGLLSPDDVADTALYLLSDGARRVTGQVIAVDGGWSATEAT